MPKSNSIRRNTAFDLTKPVFTTPQTRLEANRFLINATFGAGTPETDISASTKISIVSLAGTIDDASALMGSTYTAFVDAQLADMSLVPLYSNTFGYVPTQGLGSAGNGIFGSQFGDFASGTQAWFYTQAVHGTAQIKLKTLFALTQIFCINGAGNATQSYQLYYDMLLKAVNSSNTKSFKELLRDVTYSRAMATMLTYVNNQKENLSTNSRPDENYSREILQLFTIGLKQLNLDGTVILDSNGVEKETYEQVDIYQGAKIFTGLEYNDQNSTGLHYLQENINLQAHDTGTKTLFAYPGQSRVTIPAYTGTYFRPIETPPSRTGYVISNVTANTFQINTVLPQVENTRAGGVNIEYHLTDIMNSQTLPYATGVAATCGYTLGSTLVTVTKTAHGLSNGTTVWVYSTAQKDIEYYLEYIFNHPTVAPFIARSLIKFFVTSNPTPDYIKRVATKFNDNGNGVRGDIMAVVKALLLDREHIIPYGINPNNHGRTPNLIEQYIRVARAFKSDMFHGFFNDSSFTPAHPKWQRHDFTQRSNWFTKPRELNDYKGCTFNYTGGIQFGKPPSVFNFYRPGFVPSGTDLGVIGKTAPELQVNTIDSNVVWSNAINALCETENNISFNTFASENPTGNEETVFGFDFVPDPSGFTVVSLTDQSAQQGGGAYDIVFIGNVTGNVITKNKAFLRLHVRRRSDGMILRAISQTRPTGTGVKNVTILVYTQGTIPAVNDVFDFSPLAITNHSGFPTRTLFGNVGQFNVKEFQPIMVTFHKVANLLPNTIGIPTDAEINPAIDYLESILCTRPLTTQVRNLMLAVAKVPTTENTYDLVGDATFNNHWLNVQIGHAQKRARRMTAILLATPQFKVLR
jgi:hypothetical protein